MEREDSEGEGRRSSLPLQSMSASMKLMKIPMEMAKLPVTTMRSGMRIITDTMRGHPGDNDDVEETAGSEAGSEEEPAKGGVSNLALLPFVEMFRFQRSVFESGMSAISRTVHGVRDQLSGGNGAATDETNGLAGKGEDSVVRLSGEELSRERDALLDEDSEELREVTLWQIGRAGRGDFDGEWTEAFEYEVGGDVDQIQAPKMPHLLLVKGSPARNGGTEKLIIQFSLDHDYAAGELGFVYERWGAEKDEVFIDGALLTPVEGPGQDKFRHVALSLEGLSKGSHEIALTTTGNTAAGGHRVDCLKLVAMEEREVRDEN